MSSAAAPSSAPGGSASPSSPSAPRSPLTLTLVPSTRCPPQVDRTAALDAIVSCWETRGHVKKGSYFCSVAADGGDLEVIVVQVERDGREITEGVLFTPKDVPSLRLQGTVKGSTERVLNLKTPGPMGVGYLSREFRTHDKVHVLPFADTFK